MIVKINLSWLFMYDGGTIFKSINEMIYDKNKCILYSKSNDEFIRKFSLLLLKNKIDHYEEININYGLSNRLYLKCRVNNDWEIIE
jgi:hypothetical protein